MAIGAGTITGISGAVSDLFSAKGMEFKKQGAQFEKQNYELASNLASQNEEYTRTATAIKLAQQDRAQFGVFGGIKADVAGAGFEQSGSALDIMRDAASQGALQHAVLTEQGLITEAGYHEQAQSYTNMAGAAQVAIDAADEAQKGLYITSALKGLSAVMSLFSGGALGGGGAGGSGGSGGAAGYVGSSVIAGAG